MAVILVVDDDQSILGLVSMLLASKDHRILTASNGAEAVAVYRSFKDQIDLTITDIEMPTMDGIQEILRIRMTNPDARFICMTGNAAGRCPEDVVLLNKPFSPPELFACVDEVLQQNVKTSI
jgi:CheY-like chemotaxis protein